MPVDRKPLPVQLVTLVFVQPAGGYVLCSFFTDELQKSA